MKYNILFLKEINKRRSAYFGLSAALVFVVGCAAQTTQSVAQIPEGLQKTDALLVVDCQLPGKVRKLGTSFTYLSPRRALKTTASDCEIRGGEYVAFDRSNYATALKIWLPLAKQGQPDAQTYVGEIYEKGLGVQPDYPLALAWYNKAADQGYSRAQINLGYLYESGLGVPRDLVRAMNWYRKASGLAASEGNLEFVSSVEIARRLNVEQQAGRLAEEVDQLRMQLGEKQARMDRQVNELSQTRRQLEQARQQNEKARSQVALLGGPKGVSLGDSRQLETRITGLERQLGEAQQERQRLVSRLARQQLDSGALQTDLAETQQQLAEKKRLLRETESELQRTQKSLEDGRQTRDTVSLSQTEIQSLRSELQQRETESQRQREQIKALETQTGRERSSLTAELEDAAEKERQLKEALSVRDGDLAKLQARLEGTGQDTAQAGALTQQLTEARNERQRVLSTLAREQLASATLRERLDEVNSQLASEKQGLADSRAELERTRAALRGQTEATGQRASEAEALRINLVEQQQRLSQQQGDINQLEQRVAAGRASLEQVASASISKEKTLQNSLAQRDKNIDTLKVQLAALRTQNEGRGEEQQRLGQLEANLKQREAQIDQQRDELKWLQSEIAKKETVAAMPAGAAVAATQVIGPEIEIIDPPLSATRDAAPKILLRSIVQELELVGRVRADEGLYSFRINAQDQPLEDNGLFRAEIALKKSETPVSIVAIDKEGNRTGLDFQIVPTTTTGKSVSTDPKEPAVGDPERVDFGKYHALVIGNNKYRHLPNLGTPENDARAISALLKEKYGFKTRLLVDADRYAMLSALNELRETLTEDDNLLIYFAGHGELDQTNLRGHWLPVDAEPNSTANWISNVAVTDLLNVMAPRHILVVADSCYSGIMTRSSVARLDSGLNSDARVKWYKTMAKAKARIVLTSGGEAPVLDSGGGDHSIFAQAFLDVLRDNDQILEGYRLYRDVQARVKTKAEQLRAEQDPQYSPIKYAGHEAGEFFFLPKSRSVSAQTPAREPLLSALIRARALN